MKDQSRTTGFDSAPVLILRFAIQAVPRLTRSRFRLNCDTPHLEGSKHGVLQHSLNSEQGNAIGRRNLTRSLPPGRIGAGRRQLRAAKRSMSAVAPVTMMRSWLETRVSAVA